MCEQNESQGIVIKLTDFGFATHFDSNNPQTLSLGSPLYMAPELTTSSAYDSKVDVWAVGVILYVMVSGMYPFAGRTKEDIYLAVQTREPNYPRIQNAGEELTNVIKACLTKEVADRPTVAQLLTQPWFETMKSNNLTNETQIDIGSNLAEFSKMTNFQSGICSIIANLQTKGNELSACREMFLRFDANNDGFIDQEELAQVYGEISNLFQMEVSDVATLFSACDSNGDGKIDYQEFIAAAVDKTVLVSQDNLQAAFNLIDADGNGELTKAELQAVFAGGSAGNEGEAVWDELVAEVDEDNDGVITFVEFEKAMKSMIAKQATK